jgi:hypothetical protein
MDNTNVFKDDVIVSAEGSNTTLTTYEAIDQQPGPDSQVASTAAASTQSVVNSEMSDWEFFLNRISDLHGAGRLRICIDTEGIGEKEFGMILSLFPYAELIGVDAWGGDCPELTRAEVNRRAGSDPNWKRVVVMSLPYARKNIDWDVKASFIGEGYLHLVVRGQVENRTRFGLRRTLRVK